MAEVRVLEEIRAAPAPPIPAATLPITFFDAAWLFTGPVERLFFYRHSHPTSALPLLVASLPHALRRFYPLAGTINLSSSASPTPAATPSPSSSPSPKTQTSSTASSPRDPGTCARCARWCRGCGRTGPPPREDGAFALAALQATMFPGRGLCIGVSVHHAACDDASATLFVRTWAAACRLGGSLDDAPG